MVELPLDLPPGPRGGAVLDARGRLVGLVLPAGAGPLTAPGRGRPGDVVALTSILEGLLPASGEAPGPDAGRALARIPVGEIYERALPAVVVVLGPG
jgi:hypothetical protein